MSDKLWIPDNGDSTFTNPVIYADYSDPDVIRVGDTYYMTASSFNYCPGLPILVSKDLVNWKLVNYATKNITDNTVNNYDIPQHSRGIWAPSIRYNNGTFYIFYGMPDEGYYVVETKDPYGEWSEPYLLMRGKGYIDPCPIWDGDKAYVVHGYAKSRIGFKSFLGIFEMSPDCKSVIGEDKILYDGLATNHTIEGPKTYKIGEYFYILAPAGGVKKGWQTALRSKSIYGPFEEAYVLAKGDTIVNGPHQGSLVDDAEGNLWFVHFQDRGLYGRLTHVQPTRMVDGWPVMGEGDNTPAGPDNVASKYCGHPVITYKMPASLVNLESTIAANSSQLVESSQAAQGTTIADPLQAEQGLDYEQLAKLSAVSQGLALGSQLGLDASDDFSSDKLGLQWQWTGNYYDDFYKFVPADAAGAASQSQALRLFAKNPAQDADPTIWRSANVLTQKIITPFFDIVTDIDFSGLRDNEQTGLVMMGGEYAYIAVRQVDGQRKLVLAEAYTDKSILTTVNSMTTAYVGEKITEICDIPADCNKIQLGLYLVPDGSEPTKNPLLAVADNMKFGFYYILGGAATDGGAIVDGGAAATAGCATRVDVATAFFPADHTWVGAKAGLFTLALDTEEHAGYADFNYIHVENV